MDVNSRFVRTFVETISDEIFSRSLTLWLCLLHFTQWNVDGTRRVKTCKKGLHRLSKEIINEFVYLCIRVLYAFNVFWMRFTTFFFFFQLDRFSVLLFSASTLFHSLRSPQIPQTSGIFSAEKKSELSNYNPLANVP